MSIHSNNFYSNVLRQSVQVQVILPEPVNAVGQILPPTQRQVGHFIAVARLFRVSTVALMPEKAVNGPPFLHLHRESP